VRSSVTRCGKLPFQQVSTVIEVVPFAREILCIGQGCNICSPCLASRLLASLRGQRKGCQHDAVRGEVVSTI
jgi:hypothetical protein